MACCRHSSAVPSPASPCFKIEMICSSLCRVPFIRFLLSRCEPASGSFPRCPPIGRFPLKNFTLGSPRNDDSQLARPTAPPISSKTFTSAITPFFATLPGSPVSDNSHCKWYSFWGLGQLLLSHRQQQEGTNR